MGSKTGLLLAQQALSSVEEGLLPGAGGGGWTRGPLRFPSGTRCLCGMFSPDPEGKRNISPFPKGSELSLGADLPLL